VTTSSKKDRLEGYLGVGDIDLTPDDVKAIDHAGAKGELWEERKSKGAKVAKAGLLIASIAYAGMTVAGWVQNLA
jgi:diketogulonate reductase-like aldo/keto reductase